jgi:hypothetical protein
MRLGSAAALCVAGGTLSACPLPFAGPAITALDAVTAISLVSTATTGKGTNEHLLSLLFDEDCRILEGLLRKERNICEPHGSPATEDDWDGLSGYASYEPTIVQSRAYSQTVRGRPRLWYDYASLWEAPKLDDAGAIAIAALSPVALGSQARGLANASAAPVFAALTPASTEPSAGIVHAALAPADDGDTSSADESQTLAQLALTPAGQSAGAPATASLVRQTSWRPQAEATADPVTVTMATPTDVTGSMRHLSAHDRETAVLIALAGPHDNRAGDRLVAPAQSERPHPSEVTASIQHRARDRENAALIALTQWHEPERLAQKDDSVGERPTPAEVTASMRRPIAQDREEAALVALALQYRSNPITVRYGVAGTAPVQRPPIDPPPMPAATADQMAVLRYAFALEPRGWRRTDG